MRIMGLALLCGAMTIAAPASAQLYENGAPGQDYQTPPQAAFQPDVVRPALHPVLSADETMWHVRVALNVAALSCRDADERETAAAYNALLDQEHAPLAHALAGIEAGYHARYGSAWQAHDDGDMTRLYNFFAAPDAQPEFCATAKEVLHAAADIAPADFAAFAADALPALERPFAPAPMQMADRGPDPQIGLATNARVPFTPGH